VCFFRQPLAPGAREPIKLGLAIVFREAPFRSNVAFLFQFQERGVESPVVYREDFAANLFDASRDSIPV
jgi:hypothetical protein